MTRCRTRGRPVDRDYVVAVESSTELRPPRSSALADLVQEAGDQEMVSGCLDRLFAFVDAVAGP